MVVRMEMCQLVMSVSWVDIQSVNLCCSSSLLLSLRFVVQIIFVIAVIIFIKTSWLIRHGLSTHELSCVLVPRASSGEYCTLDSFINFSTMYIVCLFTSYISSLILFTFFLTYVLHYLSFSFRIDLLHFQAGGHKSNQTWAFFSRFSLFYVMVLLRF